jgi:hypothetical protein
MGQTSVPETLVAHQKLTPGYNPKTFKQQDDHGGSLQLHILHLYGEDTLRLFKNFDKLRMKKTNLLTSPPLLLRCRYHKTIPTFLRFRHHIRSQAANRIYKRTSLALLRERIHFNRREIDNSSRNLIKIHLQLANVLSASDWSLVDRITFNKTIRLGDEIRNRQCKKF